MSTLLISLMITWTDIFQGIGKASYWVFDIMKSMGHGPNVIIWIFIIGLIFYWTYRLNKYKKAAQRDGTYE